jgi:hypothetical protein
LVKHVSPLAQHFLPSVHVRAPLGQHPSSVQFGALLGQHEPWQLSATHWHVPPWQLSLVGQPLHCCPHVTSLAPHAESLLLHVGAQHAPALHTSPVLQHRPV